MKNTCAVLLLACFMVGLAATGGAFAQTPDSSDELTVTDSDGAQVALSLDDLRKMPQVQEKQAICVGKSSGFIGIMDYAGTQLCAVLAKAAATASAKEYRQENSYVVFKGKDGYQVIASWNELMETPDGKRAMIALERDGETLPSEEGPFRLFLPGDKYVGRSVKWLSTIEIHLAPGYQELKPRDASESDSGQIK